MSQSASNQADLRLDGEAPEDPFDNRYIAPLFITFILVVGHLVYGILESYEKTALAIVVAIVAELVLGRIFFGKWLNLASAYITGISVGILVRSPRFWPYAAVQRDLDHVEVRVARERDAIFGIRQTSASACCCFWRRRRWRR